jgi:hypothetical protein
VVWLAGMVVPSIFLALELCCDASYNFYNFINNLLLFPTILGSSILTCLNSSNIDTDRIKYTNIIINGTITIILAITTQYKIHDRISMFKSYQSKYTKLNHHIESIINSKSDNAISSEDIITIVNKYDSLVDELSFTYPNHIRNNIIKKYQKTNITLPNSLALDASVVFVNVV